MKHKIISLLILMAVCAGNCFASTDSEPVMWGIKANLGMELPGKWRGNGSSVKMFSPGASFQIGAVSNIYLGRNFYFEPGVGLYYDTYKYDGMSMMTGDEIPLSIDPAVRKFGIRVPLVVGYTIAVSETFDMSVFTGPQIGYALWGGVHTKYPAYYEGPDFFPTELFGVHGQRRFNFDWKIGVGFPVNNFLVSLEGDIGISDLLRAPDSMSFRENRFTVGVTYYF